MHEVRYPDGKARKLQLLQKGHLLHLCEKPEEEKARQAFHLQELLEHHGFKETLQKQRLMVLDRRVKILKSLVLLLLYCC